MKQPWSRMPPRGRRATWIVAAFVLAVLVAYAGNRLGAWWTTLVVGLLLGLAPRRGTARRHTVLTCLAVGSVTWGGTLALLATRGGVPRIAQVTGGLAGFGPHAGSEVIAATVVYGALLCLVGGWVGSAVRRLVTRGEPHYPVDVTIPAPVLREPSRPTTSLGKEANRV